MSTHETRIRLLSECNNSWNYLVSYLTLHLSYLTLCIASLYFTLHHTLPYLTYITLHLTLSYILLYITLNPYLTLCLNVFPSDYLTLP